MADPIPMHAPYARAAAVVARDGTLEKTKNILSVEKTGGGTYKVTVAETVDVTHAALQATAHSSANWGTEVYAKSLDAHAVQVLTGANGKESAQPFHIAVL
ncbi:hypothetical protein [Streptomyces varsoviensis]|uniref:Uncharacterized protein n=1 Tax=Streptomyces varsoviensis TaxID=67373 RepID=A0ABR5IUM9_9ACTN|nr:hypothetical protein [Streptomyces varsoviensis]KOG76083.1 hypothetical protein ADK38_39975 [Streptomyces varsoviensis]